MPFQAQNNKVIILLDDKEEKATPGGVILPTPFQAPPSFGVVVSAGPGKYDSHGAFIENPVKQGDTVYYSKPHANGIMLEDVEYIIVDADNVLAIKEPA